MQITINIDNPLVYKSLVGFLKSLGISIQTKQAENKRKSKRKYPLAGSVIKYDAPFEPATSPDEWQAAK